MGPSAKRTARAIFAILKGLDTKLPARIQLLPALMQDQPHSSNESADADRQTEKQGFFTRLFSVFHKDPTTREEFTEALHRAYGQKLFDAEALNMMEGALEVGQLCAADLMVPRAQIEAIDISEPREAWLSKVIARGHSRFPVIEGDMDVVKGILHAKDLLRLFIDPNYDVRAHLRPARFIPETQPLNVVLRDFRATRNHMALVIDEFGSISGLITIEDVIEQVVGEIDDEFDSVNPDKDNITVVDPEHWRVKAETYLDQFNEFFGVELQDQYCETVGGMVTDHFEHVPHRGETIEIDGFRFKVLTADERQAHLFLVEKLVSAAAPEASDNTREARSTTAAGGKKDAQ